MKLAHFGLFYSNECLHFFIDIIIIPLAHFYNTPDTYEIFFYYFINSKLQTSLLIFAVITLSDKLDGISARLMNQKTELGSGLDSFTDWTVIFVTFMLLVFQNYISIFWVVLLIVPSVISGVMKMAYAKRLKVVPVTFVARLSVGLTYITILSILINFRYTLYLLIAAVLTTYLSMIVYVIKTFNLLKNSAGKKKAAG